MNKIMMDAFKALENIDDELVAPIKRVINKDKKVNESKESGNSKWSNEFELKEEILANRIYEITIPVSINRINGSFTIEEPEIVEIGEIEF